MPKVKISTTDVMTWLKGQAGYIPFLGIIGLIIWTTWAEPRVKEVVKDSTKETKVKVEVLESKMEHIQFENKQQLYLLKKIGETVNTTKIAGNIGLINEPKLYGLLSTDPFPNSSGVKDLGFPYGSNHVLGIIDSILEGKVKVLYVAGLDLFKHVLEQDRERLKEALSVLSLLVVQDYKLTETVRLAHAILPGASAYEKEGTFTNDRGRVQRVRKAIEPPGTAKPDWEILTLLGRSFQEQSFLYDNPSQIMLDIARTIPAYEGLNYDNIGTLGASTTS